MLVCHVVLPHRFIPGYVFINFHDICTLHWEKIMEIFQKKNLYFSQRFLKMSIFFSKSANNSTMLLKKILILRQFGGKMQIFSQSFLTIFASVLIHQWKLCVTSWYHTLWKYLAILFFLQFRPAQFCLIFLGRKCYVIVLSIWQRISF